MGFVTRPKKRLVQVFIFDRLPVMVIHRLTYTPQSQE